LNKSTALSLSFAGEAVVMQMAKSTSPELGVPEAVD